MTETRRCQGCGAELVPDPFAGENRGREDVICPHCDGGGDLERIFAEYDEAQREELADWEASRGC